MKVSNGVVGKLIKLLWTGVLLIEFLRACCVGVENK